MLGEVVKVFLKIVLFSVFLVIIIGCSILPENKRVPLNRTPEYYNYLQPSFEDYLRVTKGWLKNNRVFLTNNHEKELSMNMPFELGIKTESDKAILLVHGLGDSPFSFSDISKTLESQGFYVQSILLPGHGSKIKDLMLPSYSDWQQIVDYYTNLLKKDFDNVWLGGYSTGGNLVTIHALQNNDIDGLLLFAPGFQSNNPVIEKFARIASLFTDVVEREEVNLVKYSSGAIQGAIAYVDSASMVRTLLEEKTVNIPTFIALSEEDSALDSASTKSLYLKRFVHPKNKMLWYGKSGEQHHSIKHFSMKLVSQKISTGSHMSPLFSPYNPYYGRLGERRLCQIKFIKPMTRQCYKNRDELWYAAWGYQEEGKKHTRLTWNPYYTELEQALYDMTN